MTKSTRSPSSAQQVYRALSSPVRTRLLEVLRDEPGLDAATMAERLGLHVNTVRTHLNLLQDATLVEVVVEDRDRPGRPRLLYRASPEDRQAPPRTEAGGYRFLAAVLASYLGAISDDTKTAAEQAGRAWGHFVIDKPAPFARPDPAAAISQVLAMLDEFGFAPELDQTDGAAPQIVLRRCPFAEVAREHQDVVCSVHLGLMRGALEELGVDVQARNLLPWAEPDACIAQLHVGPGGPAGPAGPAGDLGHAGPADPSARA